METDNRIHKHNWQSGRCSTCGIDQRTSVSESKPEPVTSKQADVIIDCLGTVKFVLWLILFILFLIWSLIVSRM